MSDRTVPSVISGSDLREGDIFTPFRKVGNILSPAPTTFTFHDGVNFGDIDKVLLLDEERKSKWPPETAKTIIIHKGTDDDHVIPDGSIGFRGDNGSYDFRTPGGDVNGNASPHLEGDSIEEWEEVSLIPTRLIEVLTKDHDDWLYTDNYSEAEREAGRNAYFHIREIIEYLEGQVK